MKKIKKTWVEFYAPGFFFGETWTKDVESLDPYNVEWPDNTYAFCLYEREDIVDGKKVFKGKPKQIGPMYYHPDSKVETLEEVKKNPNKGRCLVDNMVSNKWERVIWTRWGNWPQEFKNMRILGKK